MKCLDVYEVNDNSMHDVNGSELCLKQLQNSRRLTVDFSKLPMLKDIVLKRCAKYSLLCIRISLKQILTSGPDKKRALLLGSSTMPTIEFIVFIPSGNNRGQKWKPPTKGLLGFPLEL